MAGNRIDIEQLLKDGNTVMIKPQGYSMYPMFVPGRDSAVVAPVEPGKLKRGDVILYRREGSILVLHRVFKIRPEGMYLVGDNQTEIEGPLSVECSRGILVEFVRKGKRISTKQPFYKLCSTIWLCMRPIRHKISVFVHWLKND